MIETTNTLGSDDSIENVQGQKAPYIPSRSKYHGYPNSWNLSVAASNSIRLSNEAAQQSLFHMTALKEVRKILGSSCKYLTHVKDVDGIKFKAKVLKSGAWRTVNVDTDAKIGADLSPEDYKNLKNVLANEIRS